MGATVASSSLSLLVSDQVVPCLDPCVTLVLHRFLAARSHTNIFPPLLAPPQPQCEGSSAYQTGTVALHVLPLRPSAAEEVACHAVTCMNDDVFIELLRTLGAPLHCPARPQ